MKKQTIFAFAILILLLLALIPFQQKKTFLVKAAYFIVLPQITNPQNWLKWQPELRQAVQQYPASVNVVQSAKTFRINSKEVSFEVDPSAGYAINISKNLMGKNSTSTWLVLPENIKQQTLITGYEKINLVKLIFNYLSENQHFTDILSFKNYLEDARLYYGFDIRKTTVTDSNVVVIKRMVLARNKMVEAAKIRADLKAFLQKNQLKEVQPVIADIRPAGRDSLRMMIGLPINKASVSDGNIKYMHLPTHGRMITGLYTGKYGGRVKLYLAMKTYLSDHNYSSPEDPYEKYLDDKIPANDSSFVHLQVNFPIY